MAKIFFIMGKSASGKDTIYKRLIENEALNLLTVRTYTTRPMREGEVDGVEYFFKSNEETDTYEKAGIIIEMRQYNTMYGVWKYYTCNDGQIDLGSDKKYIVIGTLEAYLKYCSHYGKCNLYPIYIDIDDGVRLQRALDRERMQEKPKYAEMCRRFLADDKDFSEENIKDAGIVRRFINNNLDECIEEIKDYIHSQKISYMDGRVIYKTM